MKKVKTNYGSRSEELLEQAKQIIEKEGAKGWELAKETLIKQETNDLQLQEAINYLAHGPQDFFRPALLSLCSKAVGGSAENTIPYSVSLIFFSKAIGIHDDVIDNLKVRNERQTFFGKFGKDLALILSDILLFKGFTLMRKSFKTKIPQQAIAETLETIDHIWFEQGEGEVFEVRSRRHWDISPQECLAKIKKRASEFEAITRIGGILGGGSPEEVNILGKFGRLYGMMSLLRDEIIDMLELDMLRHRIRYESLPLPIIYSMNDPTLKSKIISLLSKKRLTEMDLLKISKISDKAGGINFTANQIIKMFKEACSYLDSLETKNDELKILTTLLIINPKDWRPLLGFK